MDTNGAIGLFPGELCFSGLLLFFEFAWGQKKKPAFWLSQRCRQGCCRERGKRLVAVAALIGARDAVVPAEAILIEERP